MKIGFCTMGFLPYTTLDEAIKRIGRIGFDAIDFWAYSPHLGPDRYDKERCKQVRATVQKAGLEIAALSCQGGGLAMHLNFAHSEKYVRDETLAYYYSLVDLAANVGSPLINWISGHMMYGTRLEQAWEWNRESLVRVGERAARKKITVAIHTLTPPESEVVVTIDDALRMMREVGLDNVKVMIDTADQNVTDPNLSDAVRKCGRDLVYVHTNDNMGAYSGEGRGDVHLPPGRGNIDWRQFFQTLKDIRYDGYVTAQVNVGYPVDMGAWAAESLAYMRCAMEE